MLFLVGVGLIPKHITVEGVEACKRSSKIYLETYTNALSEGTVKELEAILNKPVIAVDRDAIEGSIDKFVDEAQLEDITILVIGDPVSATTHHSLVIRANEKNVEVGVVPGISIFTVAPAVCGLQTYKFGKTTTIPFWSKNYEPESFYDVIIENNLRGLHTLALLDIKAHEGRLMSAQQACEVLTRVAKMRKVDVGDWPVIVLSKLGSKDQKVFFSKVKTVLASKESFGFPQTLIFPSDLHDVEKEALNFLSDVL